jgi:transposase
MKIVKESKEAAGKPTEIKPRRKYDTVFKSEAVALWLNSGKSAREISGELGISPSHLYDWKKAYGPLPAGSEAQRESELAALRRENALLRQQRDILKKTLGIISEPPNNASNGSTP